MKQTILFVALLELLVHGILCANPGDQNPYDSIGTKGFGLNANAPTYNPSAHRQPNGFRLNADAPGFTPSTLYPQPIGAGGYQPQEHVPQPPSNLPPHPQHFISDQNLLANPSMSSQRVQSSQYNSKQRALQQLPNQGVPHPQQYYNTQQQIQNAHHQNIQQNLQQQPYYPAKTLNQPPYVFGQSNSHLHQPNSSPYRYPQQTYSHGTYPQQVFQNKQSKQPSNQPQFNPNVQQHLNSGPYAQQSRQQPRPQRPNFVQSIQNTYTRGTQPNVIPQPVNTMRLGNTQQSNQQQDNQIPKDLQKLLADINDQQLELSSHQPHFNPNVHRPNLNSGPYVQQSTQQSGQQRHLVQPIQSTYQFGAQPNVIPQLVNTTPPVNTMRLGNTAWEAQNKKALSSTQQAMKACDDSRKRQSTTVKKENKFNPDEWPLDEKPPDWVKLFERSEGLIRSQHRVILYDNVVAAIKRYQFLVSGYVREYHANVPEALAGVIQQYMRDLGEDTDGESHASISNSGLFALYWLSDQKECNEIIVVSKYQANRSMVTWEIMDQNNQIIHPFESEGKRDMGKHGRMRLIKDIKCCDHRLENARLNIHFYLKDTTRGTELFKYTDSATIPTRPDHKHQYDCVLYKP
eukprot:148665_1